MRATVALASAQSRIPQRRLTLSSSKFKRSLRSESQRSHYAPLWIVTVASLQLWAGLTWLGLAGLIYGFAETSRHALDRAVTGQRFVFLGAASYALYMTHLPVDIVWFHTLQRLGIEEASPLPVRLAAIVGVFVVCVIVSAFAYVWLEEPARKWIRSSPLPGPRAAREPGSIGATS